MNVERADDDRTARPWAPILHQAFGHRIIVLQAKANDGSDVRGTLPLALVDSRLFGRVLVSLPYVNTAGVVADDAGAARALVDEAVRLADELDVRYLELRHEVPVEHPALTEQMTDKVHMRLALPGSTEELWSGFKSKLRSQVKKPLADAALSEHWGRHDLLEEFYGVFCRNMRDLGTPPFSKTLFACILDEFGDDAELCVIRHAGRKPIAGAILIHGDGVTQVPSASSLRESNRSGANMRMYWHLLGRAVERGQGVFDFGRSTAGSGTYRFKEQWGARPEPAVWQYYVRKGTARDLRPDKGGFNLAIAVWKRLPVAVTRWIGPAIVRGIP